MPIAERTATAGLNSPVVSQSEIVIRHSAITWPHRPAVRTPDFRSGNKGSIPFGVNLKPERTALREAGPADDLGGPCAFWASIRVGFRVSMTGAAA